MAVKPERIRTLGCGGLTRLAMELDKGDYSHEPSVVLDASDGTKDKAGDQKHVRVTLAEGTCRKLAAMFEDFADKLAAIRKSKEGETGEEAPKEEATKEEKLPPGKILHD